MKLDELMERVVSILCLPGCAFLEFASRLGLIDQQERDHRANHEAGHAIVFFLANKPITRAMISGLRGTTAYHINIALKGVVEFPAGEVNLSPEDERLFAQEHPDRNALMYLAGIASTKNPKQDGHFGGFILEQLLLGKEATWEDISVPYAYLADRFKEIHKREPEPAEVRNLFNLVHKRMSEVLARPKFLQVNKIISELIKKGALRGDINSKIQKALEENGLSKTDLAEMQEELFSIDMDQTVRETKFDPKQCQEELVHDSH